jgi:hypothetical protein
MIRSRNALVPHPDTPCRYVRAISAVVQRRANATLAFVFMVEGDVDVLRLPPAGPPGRAERLWEHTCFEAFVALKDGPAYYEINFAPSREWAAYAFRRYRHGGALELDWTPAISVRFTAELFELAATIRLDRLSGMAVTAPLRIGLSAVIENEQGERSYWALRHPPGTPDFHHPDAFALALDPARHLCPEEER